MERAGTAALRWLGALVVLAIVVVVSLRLLVTELGNAVVLGGDEPTELASGPTPEPEAEPTEPVTDGTAGPLADFVADGTQVVDTATPVVDVSGPDRAAIFVFPRVEGDLRCVEHVRLDAVVSADGPVEIGVWGASIEGAAEVGDGATLTEPVLFEGEPRAVAGTQGPEGYVPWNLTELYQEYMSSGQGGEDGPFVIGLRAVAEGAGPLRVSTSDASDQAQPILTWLGVEGCGETDADPTEAPS